LALDKPAGLLTQAARAGDDNLLDRAKAFIRASCGKTGNVYLGLVHRLDRNVSGVVVLARTSKAARRMSEAFAARQVDKRYLAWVEGETAPGARLRHLLAPRQGERGVCEAADGKEATLEYRTLAQSRGRSLLAVRLETGRKHQIRAQLALAGHPIVGDPLYGRFDRGLGRPALHSARLWLAHPVRDRKLDLRAPLPEDLRRALTAGGLSDGSGWSFRDVDKWL